MRFALYGKDPGIAPWVVLGTPASSASCSRAGATTRSAASAQLAKRGGGERMTRTRGVRRWHARAALRSARGAGLAARRGRARSRGVFPSRPITLWVPWPAGGATDLTLRLLAELAGRQLGQKVHRREPRRRRRHAGDAGAAAGRARRLHHRAAAAAGVPRAVHAEGAVGSDPRHDADHPDLAASPSASWSPTASPLRSARRPVRVRARATRAS